MDNLSLISTDLISGYVFFVCGSGSAPSVDLLFLFEYIEGGFDCSSEIGPFMGC